MVSGTQCGSVPCGARAVVTREPAYSFVPGLQPAAPAFVHAATAFRKERRSRLPPKLESTARPARLRRRVLSFRFAVADGVAPARRPRAVSLVKGAARHRGCRDRGAERNAIL